MSRRAMAPHAPTRISTRHAIAVAMSASDGKPSEINVVIWSRSGARAWGGEYGMEQYEEDPEASVFDRIRIRADALGRIS